MMKQYLDEKVRRNIVIRRKINLDNDYQDRFQKSCRDTHHLMNKADSEEINNENTYPDDMDLL